MKSEYRQTYELQQDLSEIGSSVQIFRKWNVFPENELCGTTEY